MSEARPVSRYWYTPGTAKRNEQLSRRIHLVTGHTRSGLLLSRSIIPENLIFVKESPYCFGFSYCVLRSGFLWRCELAEIMPSFLRSQCLPVYVP